MFCLGINRDFFTNSITATSGDVIKSLPKCFMTRGSITTFFHGPSSRMVSNVSFSVFAIATAIKYGTPLPIILISLISKALGAQEIFWVKIECHCLRNRNTALFVRVKVYFIVPVRCSRRVSPSMQPFK